MRRYKRSLLVLLTMLLLVSCQSPPNAVPPGASAPAPAPTGPISASPAGSTGTPTSAAAKTSSAPAPATAQPKTSLTKLKIAYTSPAGAYAPLWIAKDGGIFEQYGLDVDLQLIAGLNVAYAALISGELDAVAGSPNGILPPVVEGAKLAVIATFSDKLQYKLMAKPEIRKVEDLKGKTMGIVRLYDTDHFLINQALEKWGIDPKDIQYMATGDQAARVTALQSRQIDATTVTPPSNLVLEKAGFPMLADLGELGIPFLGVGINVSRETIEKRPDALNRLVQALVESIFVFKTDPDQSKKIIAKYLKIEDANVLQTTYDDNAARVQELPRTNPQGLTPMVQSIIAQNPKARDLDPASVIDSTFVDAIGKSGLVEKLYGRK